MDFEHEENSVKQLINGMKRKMLISLKFQKRFRLTKFFDSQLKKSEFRCLFVWLVIE